jgi:glycerophosphoryl diester phosphodiesterase
VHTPAFLDGFQAIAHRGGADDPENPAAENSLAAFQRAYDLGFRYFETDVHVTKDGVPVIFHDALLGRVTDAVGAVFDHPLEQLRQIQLRGGGTIPTVAELLDAFPDVSFNIDIKADGAAAPLAHAIDACNAQRRVLVTSFSVTRLNAFRKVADPSIALGAPRKVVAAWVAHANLGWPKPQYPAVALQVPVRSGPIPVIRRHFIKIAHRNGLKVHVWTIDDAAQMEELIDKGVDGIMTDQPAVLKDVLHQRGMWK